MAMQSTSDTCRWLLPLPHAAHGDGPCCKKGAKKAFRKVVAGVENKGSAAVATIAQRSMQPEVGARKAIQQARTTKFESLSGVELSLGELSCRSVVEW